MSLDAIDHSRVSDAEIHHRIEQRSVQSHQDMSLYEPSVFRLLSNRHYKPLTRVL
jgi:hypothetical protein